MTYINVFLYFLFISFGQSIEELVIQNFNI